LRTPAGCRDFAVLFAREHGRLGLIDEMRPNAITRVLEHCDCARRPERFLALLNAAACDYFGRGGHWPAPWPPAAPWRTALEAFLGVDAGAIARSVEEPRQIPDRLHAARVDAVRKSLTRDKEKASPDDLSFCTFFSARKLSTNGLITK